MDKVVSIIDDDEDVRGALDSLLRGRGYHVQTFASPDEFLASQEDTACLILDVRLKNADGLEFQQQLLESEATMPVILISGYGDIPMTVRAMKAGAITFLTKPFSDSEILSAVEEALDRSRQALRQSGEEADLRARFEGLTSREREVMALVAAGLMNKQIAGRLTLSEVTVKIHRGHVMRKMRAQSLADLVLMAAALGVRETGASRYRHPPDPLHRQ